MPGFLLRRQEQGKKSRFARRRALFVLSKIEEGPEEHRLDEREGVGEAGAGGRSALRLCTLGAQSPFHAEGGVHAGGGKGTDRAGLRTERADLFQGLQEPGARDRTGGLNMTKEMPFAALLRPAVEQGTALFFQY